MTRAKIAHLQKVNRLYWGDAPGTSHERQAVFDELWSAIDVQFVGFRRLDLDWDAFRDEYRDKIGRVQSYGEYAYIITLMGYVLKESHAYLAPARIATASRWATKDVLVTQRYLPLFETRGHSTIGACYRVTADEELVISSIWYGSPNPYAFKVGDEFVGFNGVPWEEWIPRLVTSGIPFGSGSPGGAVTSIRYRLLKSGMSNARLFEKINIRRFDTGEIETMDVVALNLDEFRPCPILTETEGLVSVDNPNQPLSFEDDPMFVYGIIRDKNIGYMYIKSTRPKDRAAFGLEFEKAVVSLADTDGLIIDLRYNTGGEYPEFFYRGFSHLVKGTEDRRIFGNAVRDPDSEDRTRLIGVYEAWGEELAHPTHTDDWFREVYSWYVDHLGRKDLSPFPGDEPDLYYEDSIVVLTGPDCTSGGDWLVQLLARFPEFIIIGKDPNGSNMSFLGSDVFPFRQADEYVTLAIPTLAHYYVDEQPIDHLSRRTGFADHVVWFTKEDIIKGVDTVREYAFQLITKAKRAGK
jgi:hypothetical protein